MAPGPIDLSPIERVENPWWLPKIFGKGPQTLFAEGYNKASMILWQIMATNTQTLMFAYR